MKIHRRLNTPSIKECDAKRKIFANEFLKDFNGTEAYIRAKLPHKNRSVAQSIAYKWLQEDCVQKYIADQVNKINAKAEVSVEMIIRELHAIATANALDLWEDDQTLKDLKDIPLPLQKAISSMEVQETYEGYGDERKWTGQLRKVKLWEKTKALELLGRHLAMWMDKLQVHGDITVVHAHRKAPKESNG